MRGVRTSRVVLLRDDVEVGIGTGDEDGSIGEEGRDRVVHPVDRRWSDTVVEPLSRRCVGEVVGRFENGLGTKGLVRRERVKTVSCGAATDSVDEEETLVGEDDEVSHALR